MNFRPSVVVEVLVILFIVIVESLGLFIIKGPYMLNCISIFFILALILAKVYLGITILLVAPNGTPLTFVTVSESFKKVSHQTTDLSLSPP